MDTAASKLRALRMERGVSQPELSASMNALGFKWTQTTVWETEKGKRTLKFLEAIALAETLVFDLNWLAGIDMDSGLDSVQDAYSMGQRAEREDMLRYLGAGGQS